MCGPAAALELGAIEVHSSLGQPLRASVAFALNPGERIHDYCIFLNGGRAASGLPSVNRAAIAVSGGAIRLTGLAAVRDPLLSLQLTVACPQAANLTREYSILVDPQTLPWAKAALPAVGDFVSGAPSPAPVSAERVPEQRPEPVARPAPAARPAEQAPVALGSSYRVQRGDTLSGIAQRIPGRIVTIWQAVDAIFAANPRAFLNNDPDRLQAGTLLVIPDTLQGAVAESAEAAVAVPPAAQADAAHPFTHTETAAPAPAAEPALTAEVASPATAASDHLPRAGDVLPGADGPFVAPIETIAPSMPLAEPSDAAAKTPVAVPAARAPSSAGSRNQTLPGGDGRSWSSLGWLGGSGVLLILGLLFGGRALRSRFSRDPAGRSGEGIEGLGGDSAGRAAGDNLPDVDFRFDEPVANARMIALDADLDAGTGLQDGGDIHVAQDFGFSAAGDLQAPLDIDFAAEPVLRRSDDRAVITAKRRTPDSILVSEILPGSGDEFSQYDLSMIVDATQQPVPDSEATTKDLKAIELDAAGGLQENSEPPTLSGALDYRILEQDYEDELTATQALNAQLTAAARDLSRELHGGPEDGTEPALPAVASLGLDIDLTAALLQPGDDTTAIERTLEMPGDAESRPLRNADDTGVNEELTTEMPAAENDAIADLEIESATIDTRKMKAY